MKWFKIVALSIMLMVFIKVTWDAYKRESNFTHFGINTDATITSNKLVRGKWDTCQITYVFVVNDKEFKGDYKDTSLCDYSLKHIGVRYISYDPAINVPIEHLILWRFGFVLTASLFLYVLNLCKTRTNQGILQLCLWGGSMSLLGIVTYWSIVVDTLPQVIAGDYSGITAFTIFLLLLFPAYVALFVIIIRKQKVEYDISKVGIEIYATILKIHGAHKDFKLVQYEYLLPSGEKKVAGGFVNPAQLDTALHEGAEILIRYHPNKPKYSIIVV